MQNEKVKNKYVKYAGKEGDVFGRLTLTGKTFFKEKSGKNRRFVEARCVCGVVDDYVYNLLTRGETRSCGCLRAEVCKTASVTHGLTKHPLYEVYQAMIKRCFVEKTRGYCNYGGRGITVCDEWRNSFVAFYTWAINNGYETGKSLDRRENDGDYEPENCRFVTRGIQNRNTRSNRIYRAFGEDKCLWDWGNDPRCIITVWGLRKRMDSGKWDDIEKAMTTPIEDRTTVARNSKRAKKIEAFGEEKCMAEWLEDSRCLVKIDSFRDRMAKGWSAEKTMSTPPSRDGKNTK